MLHQFRCLLAETLIGWALSLYPNTAPNKVRLAIWIKSQMDVES